MSRRKRSPVRTDVSTLDAHHQHGKTLTPPMMRREEVELHSWHNERLPGVLWAALLTRALHRDDYMNHLGTIAKKAMEFRKNREVYPEHTVTASISPDQFQSLYGAILSDDKARAALSPLLLFDELPDRDHWRIHLSPPDEESGWLSIADAVANCLDRRAKPAIDIRWLRVMFLALQHRLRFLKGEQDEIVDMLCTYPENQSDPSLTEAMIASLEMMTTLAVGNEENSNWSEVFWRECLEKTQCIITLFEKPDPDSDSEFDYEPAKTRWGEIYAGLFHHFFGTLRTTGVDPRHDAVFGLALYGMTLVTGMMRPFSTRASGRHLLRSLAETCITLAYLLSRDETDLWRMYRTYGTGQTKLAFLKMIERENKELPKHVDIAVLENLANEDMWQEFVPINLGHWAKLNIRKMAEEGGVTDIYDAYFVWPSGFVHGHWGAVRDSVFDICANPLHRFHRIPRPFRLDMSDVCFDAVAVMNHILDLVNRAYPSFTKRFDVAGPAPEIDIP